MTTLSVTRLAQYPPPPPSDVLVNVYDYLTDAGFTPELVTALTLQCILRAACVPIDIVHDVALDYGYVVASPSSVSS